MAGELYKASSNESWRVELSPLSPDSNNGHMDIREQPPTREGVDKTDSVSECSNQSDEQSIDFLKDDKRDMTFGRRIALCLMNKTWYNPRAKMMVVADADKFKADKVQLERNEPASLSVSTTKIDDFDAMMSNTNPSLEKAWAYFEHVALYRYIVRPEEERNIFSRVHGVLSGTAKLERAEPGENHDQTRLYHPIMTPHSQLGLVC